MSEKRGRDEIKGFKSERVLADGGHSPHSHKSLSVDITKGHNSDGVKDEDRD